MKKAQAAFSEYIRRQGLKLTRPRLAILDEIIGTPGHFTAEDLYEKMRHGSSPAGKATIYRTLELLAKGGFLEAHDFGGSQTYYEKILGRAHHDHMVCLNCHKVIEFQCAEIEDLQDQQARHYHFLPVTHSLKMFGYCSACAKKLGKVAVAR